MSALELENVSVAFAGRNAVSAVSVAINAGEVTGIVGPNGAGKTTLLRSVLGFQKLTRGNIRILGRPLADWDRTALARHMAYLPQGGDARWPMLASEVVMLGRLPHRAPFQRSAASDELAVAHALARADAAEFVARRMDQLSAGERARVLFARALATGADILIADEPAAYLDPSHQLRLMDLLREEAARGTAVILTLHDLALAGSHCDRVLVMSGGRLDTEGPPAEALADATLARVFQIVRAESHGAYRRI